MGVGVVTAPALTDLTQGLISRDLLLELTEEVGYVEEELNLQMRSQVELVAQVGKHTLRAGGKRLRPAFVAIGARATGLPFDPSKTRRLGACMEMIHMATLVHDDVLDGADLRRGLPTVARTYGDEMAVSTGNFLLAQAFAELAGSGDAAAVAALSEVAWGLSEGERLQAADAFRTSVTVEDYIRRCRLNFHPVQCRALVPASDNEEQNHGQQRVQ